MEKIKQQLIKIGKKLRKNGFSPGCSGNISVRYSRYFLISPSGKALGDFAEEEIVLVDENYNVIDGKVKPSSEAKLHLEIYKLRPDIEAVIHCHAPKSSAFAVANIPISQPVLSESVFHIGEVPVAKYFMPSSDAVAKETAQYFTSHNAVLMKNHGVVAGGKTLQEAYYKIETVEYTADVILNAKILGNATELNADEVHEIQELRKTLGK